MLGFLRVALTGIEAISVCMTHRNSSICPWFRMRFACVAIVLCTFIVDQAEAAAKKQAQEKTVVGYVEKVTIPRVESTFKAKMDTGALTSSIHAEIIELVEPKEDEDGKGYVIFTIESDEGSSNHIKKPLTRMVRIKKKTGGHLRRPVVEMTLCIAGVLLHEEVNLSDRDDFNYDVLIGRNVLIHGHFIVDSAKTFTTRPSCPKKEEEKGDDT